MNEAAALDTLPRLPGFVGTERRSLPECGSPRLVSHPELLALSIAHVDCDAFYAAVEKRDNPSLADRPVIVGGGKRGVVSTACYVARTFGVRSAMPMFKALEACPHAVVIPPDMAKYARVGREVRELMLALTPAVEPLSIDEAFLDLTGTERLHQAPPALTLGAVPETRRGGDRRHRLDRAEPQQISCQDRVGSRQAARLRRHRSRRDGCVPRAQPVSVIWGVGKKMQERLAHDGLNRIADLQKRDERDLSPERYGSIGIRLARLSRGEDDRTVVPEREAKRHFG